MDPGLCLLRFSNMLQTSLTIFFPLPSRKESFAFSESIWKGISKLEPRKFEISTAREGTGYSVCGIYNYSVSIFIGRLQLAIQRSRYSTHGILRVHNLPLFHWSNFYSSSGIFLFHIWKKSTNLFQRVYSAGGIDLFRSRHSS